jgi:surface antigen
MSLNRKILAIGLLLTFAVWRGAASFAAQEAALSVDDQQSLEQAISNVAETARSGNHVPWHGSADIGGTVIPGPAYSNATGTVCDQCTDPCRKITYTVVTPQALFEYRGARCRQTDNSNPAVSIWVKRQSDRQTRYLPAVVASTSPPTNGEQAPITGPPATAGQGSDSNASATVVAPTTNGAAGALPPPIPAVSPDTVALEGAAAAEMRRFVMDMQTQLTSLLYYHGPIDGKFGNSTKQALSAFLADERSSYSPTPMYEVLQLLKSASARIVRTACNTVSGNQLGPDVACGTISE